MARTTALTEGLHGIFNQRPVQTGITVPVAYLDYVKERIRIEELGSLSLVIRQLLVEKFGCPVDEADAETILSNLQREVANERAKKARAASRIALMEQAAEEQEKADSED